MSSYDMAAELVDALEAGVNKIERLEEKLRERDATIAHLRACEVAFHKPFYGGSDENGKSPCDVPQLPISISNQYDPDQHRKPLRYPHLDGCYVHPVCREDYAAAFDEGGGG